MYLSRIELHQFRSHHDEVFQFDPGVTIITGPNGSGKTNLLEAIYVLATGSSFRDSDEDLAEYDKEWWKIYGVIDDAPREIRYQSRSKTLTHRDTVRRRLTSNTRLPIVLFEPDDLLIIHGSPARRRRYIDKLISNVDMTYAPTLRRYERIVSQRNSLLKSHSSDLDTLFVLDIMLAEHADRIVSARRKYIDLWSVELGGLYSAIAGVETHIDVAYHTKITSPKQYKQALLSSLKHHLAYDRVHGVTSAGPHRDDVEFFINHKPFVTTASRGEVRSLLLALKKCEASMLQHTHNVEPIVIWDDVMSELDMVRRRAITDYHSTSQIIMTSTERYHDDSTAHYISLELL